MAGLLSGLGSLFGAPSPSPQSGPGQGGQGQGQGQDGPGLGGDQGSSGGAQQQDPPSPQSQGPSSAPAPSSQQSTPQTQPQNSNTPSPAPSSNAPSPSTQQQQSTHQTQPANAATTLLTTQSITPTSTVSAAPSSTSISSATSAGTSTTSALTSPSSTPSSAPTSPFPQGAAVGIGVTLGLIVLFGLIGAALKLFYFDRDITSRPKLWPPTAWFSRNSEHHPDDFLDANGGKVTEENVLVTGTAQTSGLPPLPPKDSMDVEKGGMSVGVAEVVEFQGGRSPPTPIVLHAPGTQGAVVGNETSRENAAARVARKPVGSAAETTKETPWGPDAIGSPTEKEGGQLAEPKARGMSPTVGEVEQPRRVVTRGSDPRPRQMDPRMQGSEMRARPSDPRSRLVNPRTRGSESTTRSLSRNTSSDSLGQEREVVSFLDFPPPPVPQEGYRAYQPRKKKSELFLD